MTDTILMDLDGTLLPFEQQEFVDTYFPLLCAKAAPFGYAPDRFIKGIWAGVKAMTENDGTCLNRDRFWQALARVLDEKVLTLEEVFNAFYANEFDAVKSVVHEPTPARAVVTNLKQKGYTVVLATNPIFPLVAVRTRLSWAGLTPEDFALVTHYGNSTLCKPNPRYFDRILQTLGKTPEHCLMAGNNVAEDMVAGTRGIKTFLVTDHLENEAGEDISRFRRGSLADFAAFCHALPTI